MAMPEDDPPAGVPEWVVTYGDMMSLLLTFFIMLVSMSELKQEGKIRAMLDSIRECFGASVGPSGVPGPSTQTSSIYNKRSSTGTRSEGGMKKFGRNSKGLAGPHKTVKRVNHGTVVTLGGPTMFESFSADLTPEMRDNLDTIASVLAAHSNRIVVRGHASPEPLPEGSPYSDQMDLSFARAQNVTNYLVEKGIPRSRIVVQSSGAHEPLTITRQQESQEANHRVDVFIIDSYITPAQSPVEELPTE